MREFSFFNDNPFVKVMALVIVILAITFGVLGGRQTLMFWPIEGPTDFLQRIAPLFAIALFIERALEVFMPVWRGEDECQLKANLGRPKPSVELEGAAAARAAGFNVPNLGQSPTTYSRADVLAFKAETRKIAAIAGLTLGVIVSAVGVRALSLFFYATSIDSLAHWQKSVFGAVDVFVTGALIGGGADGLHQIVNVFLNFMSVSSDRIEARRPGPDARAEAQ